MDWLITESVILMCEPAQYWNETYFTTGFHRGLLRVEEFWHARSLVFPHASRYGWSFHLTLSFQSPPLLYFLFSVWMSLASPTHFLLLTHYPFFIFSAFSQLLVLTWQMFSNLVLVYLLISANKVLHLVLVTPNFPPARFCQSCVPCSTSPSSSC